MTDQRIIFIINTNHASHLLPLFLREKNRHSKQVGKYFKTYDKENTSCPNNLEHIANHRTILNESTHGLLAHFHMIGTPESFKHIISHIHRTHTP